LRRRQATAAAAALCDRRWPATASDRAACEPRQSVRQLRQPRLLHRAERGEFLELRAQCLRLPRHGRCDIGHDHAGASGPDGTIRVQQQKRPGRGLDRLKDRHKPRQPVAFNVENGQDGAFPQGGLSYTFAQGQKPLLIGTHCFRQSLDPVACTVGIGQC
jgi:hypothetical protein